MTSHDRDKPPLLLLDSFSIKDLDRWEAQKEKILRYHWDLYSSLAYERRKIADQLRLVLIEAATAIPAGVRCGLANSNGTSKKNHLGWGNPHIFASCLEEA